jgi:hypothetical protein
MQKNKTIYKVCFKLIVTSKTEIWALIKRNKSKIEAMDMTFFRSIEGKTRRGNIRNEILRKGAGVQNLLTELEEKLLKWFYHVKRLDRAMILKRALKLKFKGQRPVG